MELLEAGATGGWSFWRLELLEKSGAAGEVWSCWRMELLEAGDVGGCMLDDGAAGEVLSCWRMGRLEAWAAGGWSCWRSLELLEDWAAAWRLELLVDGAAG